MTQTTYTPLVFMLPGVNPQSMAREVSGDSVIHAHVPQGTLTGVIDGAWVRGFESLEAQGLDVANWASSTTSRILGGVASALPDTITLTQLVEVTNSFYCSNLIRLREQARYVFNPPPAYAQVDMLKVMPQSAAALILQRPNGTIELCQWRDCLIVAEYQDGTMQRLTPNQSELVATATKQLPYQHEGLQAYQALVKEAMDAGKPYGSVRDDVRQLAAKSHKPAFLKVWLEAETTLPDTLTGKEGFDLWRQTLDTLCLFQNSSLMLNNLNAPMVTLTDGTTAKGSWAMLTGEVSMMPLVFQQTLLPEHTRDLVCLWVMSDGAFKQGDRGSDLNAMRELGPERYYTDTLLRRFDGSKPTNRRYADDRVPMDVTIVRIPLK